MQFLQEARVTIGPTYKIQNKINAVQFVTLLDIDMHKWETISSSARDKFTSFISWDHAFYCAM